MSLLNNLSQEAQTCKYSCKVISCWKIIYNFIFLIWMKREWTILLTNLLGSHLWRCTQLSNFTFTFHFHALEKEMATHSRILAWRIPGTGESGGLPSIGSHRVGHDWATSLSLFTFMHWRRKWQPTPQFLPGESQGQGSLVGCHLWGRTESDMTDVT